MRVVFPPRVSLAEAVELGVVNRSLIAVRRAAQRHRDDGQFPPAIGERLREDGRTTELVYLAAQLWAWRCGRWVGDDARCDT
ncbi:hypothetical protein Acsp06_41460 [Actinomycetospora sp. NBRC 106375]|uniref:hypothetical protein n=1 Tax=Actinomycetospora sp. NBRC 106375 TaxID=3032207 RepID=UPI0024A075D9|nr:hypothetical protein [Actinomycetospora sp. NBRC 106375]GLZ47961.1 hypothetical protein Acsp06_41460 [Actinomycetospora sp. NBRC 106375]